MIWVLRRKVPPESAIHTGHWHKMILIIHELYTKPLTKRGKFNKKLSPRRRREAGTGTSMTDVNACLPRRSLTSTPI